MSQDLQVVNSNQLAPFGQGRAQGALSHSVNAGSVTIEVERAVAEARGQMQLAKMYPRDLTQAHAELMDACKIPALANVAFYSVPQGGQKVTGPSIRLAEQIAACVGNFEFGHRELSRVEATPTSFGRSEVEVYAWDKEKNNRSIRQITVLHVLDTKDGPRRLRDQKDIDNKIANVASKQARGRILALLPKWLVEAAVEECKKTLAGDNSRPIAARVRDMTQAFAKYGVTTAHLEAYLGHGLDTVLADELADLTGVYNAIKDGAAPSDYFTLEKPEASATPSGIAETARKAGEEKAAQTAAIQKPASAGQRRAAAQRQEPPAPQEQAPQQEQAQAEPQAPAQDKAAPAAPQAPAAEDGADPGDFF